LVLGFLILSTDTALVDHQRSCQLRMRANESPSFGFHSVGGSQDGGRITRSYVPSCSDYAARSSLILPEEFVSHGHGIVDYRLSEGLTGHLGNVHVGG